METITDLGNQWIRNILNKIETEEGKFKKAMPSDYFQAEVYSEPFQTPTMGRFAKIVDSFQALINYFCKALHLGLTGFLIHAL